MKRRKFIAGLGSAVAWPLAVRAQQPKMPVIGYISSGLAPTTSIVVPGLTQGLSEMGYVEGRNVAFEFRGANNEYDQLLALATDLVHRKVAVIVAMGTANAAMAAKAATTTI